MQNEKSPEPELGPELIIEPVSVSVPPATSPPAPSAEMSMQTAPATTASAHVSPGTLVLQWLTYAFWGWTVLAISIMTWAVISYFMNGTNISDGAVYGVAALLVLLPLSVICDVFYHKYEPDAKTGASSVIMIVHSVIFALCGIGALISAVMALVNSLISTSIAGATNTLVTSLIVFFIYLLVFGRTILPKKITFVRNFFLLFTMVAVIVICVLSFVGPIASKKLIQYDSDLDSSLNSVVNDIKDYAKENKKLPKQLNDLKLSTIKSAELVVNGAIKYSIKDPSNKPMLDKSLYYQVCVIYKSNSNSSVIRNDLTTTRVTSSSNNYDDYHDYDGYLNTYNHPKGEYCYKLVIDYEVYNYNNLNFNNTTPEQLIEDI